MVVIYFACTTDRIELSSEQQGGESQEDLSLQREPKNQLKLTQILGVMRSLFGFLIQFFAYFILSFNTPILNTHLDRIGYDPKFIGISISVVAFFYAVSVPCV